MKSPEEEEISAILRNNYLTNYNLWCPLRGAFKQPLTFILSSSIPKPLEQMWICGILYLNTSKHWLTLWIIIQFQNIHEAYFTPLDWFLMYGYSCYMMKVDRAQTYCWLSLNPKNIVIWLLLFSSTQFKKVKNLLYQVSWESACYHPANNLPS